MSITPSPDTSAERVERALRGEAPRSIVSRLATPVRADWPSVAAMLSLLPYESVHRVHDFVQAPLDEQDRYPLWDLAEPYTYSGPLWTGRDQAVHRLLHVRAVVPLGAGANRDDLKRLESYGQHLGMTDDEILSVLEPLTVAATTGRGLTWTRS